jgi:small conductance mechanosensitive channel
MELLADVNWTRIVAIVAAGLLALVASRYVLRHVRRVLGRRADDDEERKRVATVVRIVKQLLTALLLLVMAMLVLAEMGVSIAPLLGAAGVAGIAVGLAAQNVAKDFIRGFELLVDNEIRVGDVVEVAGKTGVVEEVSLRGVRLRDYEGTVHFIPSGEIKIVSNRSYGFAYATLGVGIGYGVDVDRATRAIRGAADGLRAEPAWARRILEPIEIAGVDQLGDWSVTIRARIKVSPDAQADVRRELLKRVKDAFDRDGIEIPFPHVTVAASGSGHSAPDVVAGAATRALPPGLGKPGAAAD